MLVKLSESPVAEAHLVASSAMLALIGLLANLPVGNGGTAAPAIRALHNLLVRSEATAALACCLNCVPPLLRLIEHGNLVASHRAAAAWTAAGAAARGGGGHRGRCDARLLLPPRRGAAVRRGGVVVAGGGG